MMYLVVSPYADIQGLLWVSGVVRGDSSYPNNPFRWYEISLDLPGDRKYSPKIPWMSKFQGGTQDMAAYFTTYVDDSRVVAESSEEAQGGSWRVG